MFYSETVLIKVKRFNFDLFRVVHGDLFRLKWGVGAGLVDTALTRVEIKNCKQLKFNYLQFYMVPRTGLEPARLAALAPETSASTIPPPGLLCVQR